MATEPLVKNAASAKQVKASSDKEKRKREAQLEDIRLVLRTIEGRRLIWRIMSECKIFGSVHHPSGSQVYYNSGRQDLGHFLLAEIIESDEQQLFHMMKEAKGYDNV